MSRKKIVAGNWKMNTDLAEAVSLVNAILEGAGKNKEVIKLVFPPFPFLASVNSVLQGKPGFFTGAQNCSEHAKGAYTGEVAANMLTSVGCSHVLVGHSERRTYFKENAAALTGKIQQALENNLVVIFCFGEQLAERKNNTYFETVKKQLHEVLENYPKDKLNSLILAYEPVWAIGTGETASPQQAQDMHAYVRSVISELFSKEAADAISILYGGSCNAQNAAELFACPDVDGGLIGGASLKAGDFCKIIDSF